MTTYVFPGLWPFIERVARGRDLHHLGRAREVWHCRQIQDALGQLPRLDAESRTQLLGHVLKVRASLAVAIEGIDAAIGEVIGALELPALEGDPCGAAPQAVREESQEWGRHQGRGLLAEGVASTRKRETRYSSK